MYFESVLSTDRKDQREYHMEHQYRVYWWSQVWLQSIITFAIIKVVFIDLKQSTPIVICHIGNGMSPTYLKAFGHCPLFIVLVCNVWDGKGTYLESAILWKETQISYKKIKPNLETIRPLRSLVSLRVGELAVLESHGVVVLDGLCQQVIQMLHHVSGR